MSIHALQSSFPFNHSQNWLKHPHQITSEEHQHFGWLVTVVSEDTVPFDREVVITY